MNTADPLYVPGDEPDVPGPATLPLLALGWCAGVLTLAAALAAARWLL